MMCRGGDINRCARGRRLHHPPSEYAWRADERQARAALAAGHGERQCFGKSAWPVKAGEMANSA